jgi:hypothetical protein
VIGVRRGAVAGAGSDRSACYLGEGEPAVGVGAIRRQLVRDLELAVRARVLTSVERLDAAVEVALRQHEPSQATRLYLGRTRGAHDPVRIGWRAFVSTQCAESGAVIAEARFHGDGASGSQPLARRCKRANLGIARGERRRAQDQRSHRRTDLTSPFSPSPHLA